MKVRILETLHANRDGSCTTYDRGEVADLPPGTAKCLIRSRKALPVEDTDVTFAADVRKEGLKSILDRYGLSVKLVAEHEEVRTFHQQYKRLVHRLEDALEEVQASRALLEKLRAARDDAETDPRSDAPEASEIQRVEELLANAEDEVETLRSAMDEASDHFTTALDEAHRRAEQDARDAHAALLEEALSAARAFQDLLSDLVRFEEGFSDRVRRRVGGLPELDRWIRDAEYLT